MSEIARIALDDAAHRRRRRIELSDAQVRDKIAELVGRAWEDAPEKRDRILATDGWIMGTEEPPDVLDVAATTYYAIAFLGVTHHWRLDSRASVDDNRIWFIRLFLRQFIHFVRHEATETPEVAKSAIDRSFEVFGMDSQYDPYSRGNEVIAVYTNPKNGTLFQPLGFSVQESVRHLTRRPDAETTAEDRRRWCGLAVCLVKILCEHLSSQYHRETILHTLACYLRVAAAAAAGAAGAASSEEPGDHDLGRIGERIREYCEVLQPVAAADLDRAIRSLEIVIGDRAETPGPKLPGTWRDRRKAARERARRR